MKELLVLLLVNFGSIDAQRTCDQIQSDDVVQKIPFEDENGGDHCFFELGPQILETIALDDGKKLDTVGNYFAKLQTECNKIKEGSTLPAPSNKEILQYFVELFLRLHKNKHVALDVQVVGTKDQKIQVSWANDSSTDGLVDANDVFETTVPGFGKPLHWKDAAVSSVTFFSSGDSIDLISFSKDSLILDQPYVPFCQYTVRARVRRDMVFPDCKASESEYSLSFTHPNGGQHCFFRLAEKVRDKALFQPPGSQNKIYSRIEYAKNARKVCNDIQPGAHLPATSDKELMQKFTVDVVNSGEWGQIELGGKHTGTSNWGGFVKNYDVTWDNGVNSTIQNGSDVWGIRYNATTPLKFLAVTDEMNSITFQANKFQITPFRGYDLATEGNARLYCHYIFPPSTPPPPPPPPPPPATPAPPASTPTPQIGEKSTPDKGHRSVATSFKMTLVLAIINVVSKM